MATTTTIYADTDANLRENAPDTNYSGNSVFRIGQYTGYRRHAVLHFDVSAYSVPSDIVSAKLYLTASGDTGPTRTMKIARLNQDYVEAEVTWNVASTGVSWTGGAGGEGNGAFTEPTYSISVGDGEGDQEVDIKELVVDAINRRDDELWLIICFDPTDTATEAGRSYFYPSEYGTASYRPKIAVTVARRVVWDGAYDGDAENGLNWGLAGTAPTTSDYVLFNSGSVSVTSGSISCHSLFISKDYTGEILATGGGAINLVSSTSDTGNVAVIKKKIGRIHLSEYDDYNRTVYILDTPSDECTFETRGGNSFDVFVDKTTGMLNVVGDSNLIVGFNKNKKRVTTSGTVTDIIACGKTVYLDNGCNDLTICNNGKVVCNSGSVNDITIGKGIFSQKSIAVNDVVMYGGEFNFKDNENAVSDTNDVTLYQGSKFIAKSNSVDWTPQGDLIIWGGNFTVDSAQITVV